MLMDLVCKACGELIDDAVKRDVRIRVLSSDRSLVSLLLEAYVHGLGGNTLVLSYVLP